MGKTDPYTFCIDEADRKIIDYLIHYKGATTPELADYLKTNRWFILNRLRKLQKTSKKTTWKANNRILRRRKNQARKKAWWINERTNRTITQQQLILITLYFFFTGP